VRCGAGAIHRHDPAQQPAEQIGSGDDPLLCAPDQNQIVVDNVVVGTLRHDFHVPDDVAKFCLHVAHNDWPMPIVVGIDVELIEQRVTEELMGIQHKDRLAGEVGDDDPFLARGVDLPEESIIRRTFEMWQHAAIVRLRQADDALRVHHLALVHDQHIVEIEKIAGADRLQFSNIAAAGGAEGIQRPNVTLAQIGDALSAEPPIEQHRGRLGQGIQRRPVKV